jgi:hypothetical protein
MCNDHHFVCNNCIIKGVDIAIDEKRGLVCSCGEEYHPAYIRELVGNNTFQMYISVQNSIYGMYCALCNKRYYEEDVNCHSCKRNELPVVATYMSDPKRSSS